MSPPGNPSTRRRQPRSRAWMDPLDSNILLQILEVTSWQPSTLTEAKRWASSTSSRNRICIQVRGRLSEERATPASNHRIEHCRPCTSLEVLAHTLLMACKYLSIHQSTAKLLTSWATPPPTIPLLQLEDPLAIPTYSRVTLQTLNSTEQVQLS